MVDIIADQMGKVGSTAICQGLKAAGVAAVQSYFLDRAALVKVL